MLDNSAGILMVEDDEVDVMTLKRAFKKNNILNPVQIAGNGEEALQILRENETSPNHPLPKIILLDINMPRMGGIEFLEELRKDPNLNSISVFVLTTSDSEEDIIKTASFNVAGYIIKPLTFEKFQEALKVLDDYWSICEYPNNEK